MSIDCLARARQPVRHSPLPRQPAHVAGGRLGVVAERLAGLAEQQVASALHRLGRRCDAEKAADGVVVRVEVRTAALLQLVAVAPLVEHELRSPYADRRVDERASTQADGLHGGHHGAEGRAQASLAHGSRHRERAIELEVVGREGRPLFEKHDALARFDELLRHDGAARTRTHHDDIGLLREVAVVLGEDAHLTAGGRGLAHEIFSA